MTAASSGGWQQESILNPQSVKPCPRCGATQAEIKQARRQGDAVFGVACGCSRHGDHFGCTRECYRDGCHITVGREAACDHSTRDAQPAADPGETTGARAPSELRAAAELAVAAEGVRVEWGVRWTAEVMRGETAEQWFEQAADRDQLALDRHRNGYQVTTGHRTITTSPLPWALVTEQGPQ